MAGKAKKKSSELEAAMDDAIANEQLDSLLRRRSTELAIGIGDLKKFIEEIEYGFPKTAKPKNSRYQEAGKPYGRKLENRPQIYIISEKISLEKVPGVRR